VPNTTTPHGRSKEKTDRRYIFYRYYCVVVVVLWIGVNAFIKSLPIHEFLLLSLVIVPFVVPAIFMVLNLGAFKFQYSVFGPLERSLTPKETASYISRGTSGAIGWIRGSMPFFSYWIYPSGMGISVLGAGKAFLSFNCVDDVQQEYLRGHRIIHHSPEIRSPISLPSEKLFSAFQEQYEKFRTNKQV